MLLQLLEALAELVVGGSTEAANADIAYLGTEHVGSIDGVDRNLVAHYSEQQGVCYLPPDDAQADLSSLGTTQTTHDFLFRHLDTCNNSVVNLDYAVASQDAYLLRRTVGDRLDDQQGVLYHVELYTNALEVTLQGFVGCFYLLGGKVAAVGVQFFQHTPNAVFYQFLFVNAVDIEVVDGHFGNL